MRHRALLPDRDNSKTTSLVSDRVGDRFYLREIWGVENSGREVKRAGDSERQHLAASEVVIRLDQKRAG
ncbi:MAG TPA: hypothetical protein VFV19_09520 [Candidatus Polarisedimenticolaceae bacterium]|nr:hypothetical protein [Candidatus Polarisedimenticolaceae bacterium]